MGHAISFVSMQRHAWSCKCMQGQAHARACRCCVGMQAACNGMQGHAWEWLKFGHATMCCTGHECQEASMNMAVKDQEYSKQARVRRRAEKASRQQAPVTPKDIPLFVGSIPRQQAHVTPTFDYGGSIPPPDQLDQKSSKPDGTPSDNPSDNPSVKTGGRRIPQTPSGTSSDPFKDIYKKDDESKDSHGKDDESDGYSWDEYGKAKKRRKTI